MLLSALPTHQMAQLGVVKSNQVIMDFGKLTIWDSLLLACAEARFERPHRILSERSVYSRHEEEIRAWLDFFPFVDPTGFAESAGEKKLLDIVRSTCGAIVGPVQQQLRRHSLHQSTLNQSLDV